jgi:hypothetical protein
LGRGREKSMKKGENAKKNRKVGAKMDNKRENTVYAK